MTCEDIERSRGRGQCTRAERAAAVNHVRGCKACQARVMAALQGASLGAIVAAAEQIAADRCDPEFVGALKK